jgi:hypothetical protein
MLGFPVAWSRRRSRRRLPISCKLILVAPVARREGMESMTQVAKRIFGAVYDPPENMWLAVLFSPSEASQAAGMAFLKRKHLRQEGRDPEVNDKVSPARLRRWTRGVARRRGHQTI